MKSIIKNKWLVLISCLFIAGLALWSSFRIEINPDIESYLPDNISSKINSDSIESIFGKDEPVLIVFHCDNILEPNNLKQLYQVDSCLAEQEYYSDFNSLFNLKEISSEDDMMIVEPLIDYHEILDQDPQILKNKITNNKQAYEHFVSNDFTTSFLILNADNSYGEKRIIENIETITSQVKGKGKFYIYGPLYMRYEANQKIALDFMILLPLGILVMMVFLFLAFRQKRAVLLPLSVVLISMICSFGLMPLMGWELSIIGILLPVMMIAIANDYGIHFITKYQELSVTHQELPEDSIVLHTANYLKKPVLMAGATTMIGLFGMALHIIIPAKQLGLIASLGIAVAVFLSLVLIPAWMVLIRKKSNGTGYLNGKNLIRKLLSKSAQIIQRNAKQISLLFIIFFMLSFLGFFRFEIARDFDKILHKEHPYSIAKQLATEKLGGTKNIRVLFKGDAKDPDFLKNLDNYQQELEGLPQVGSASSLSTLIKEMTKAMNNPGSPEYEKIPPTRNSIAQYLELYSMSGDPADLEDFTDFNFEYAVMEVQFRTDKSFNTDLMKKRIVEIVGNDPAFCFMGGYCLIEDQMNNYIAKGQLYSLIFALLAIIIVLSLIFKSVQAGLLGGLPLLVTVLTTMGFMGFLGIELNIVTALISSISIGLGVDYTIHIFWRIKKELNKGANYQNAILSSIVTTGYGVTINALSVIIGFSVLLFSSFGIIRDFSILIMFSIALCLFCSLILIPAICMLTKPKFLTK